MLHSDSDSGGRSQREQPQDIAAPCGCGTHRLIRQDPPLFGFVFVRAALWVAGLAFKKGPDYIDAAWLSWAAGRPAHNLDTFLMGHEGVVAAFTVNSIPDGLNLIEGNRGIYDGLDAKGTHSTAELAKTLRAPVVLVVNATKVTRTAAALVLAASGSTPS